MEPNSICLSSDSDSDVVFVCEKKLSEKLSSKAPQQDRNGSTVVEVKHERLGSAVTLFKVQIPTNPQTSSKGDDDDDDKEADNVKEASEYPRINMDEVDILQMIKEAKKRRISSSQVELSVRVTNPSQDKPNFSPKNPPGPVTVNEKIEETVNIESDDSDDCCIISWDVGSQEPSVSNEDTKPSTVSKNEEINSEPSVSRDENTNATCSKDEELNGPSVSSDEKTKEPTEKPSTSQPMPSTSSGSEIKNNYCDQILDLLERTKFGNKPLVKRKLRKYFELAPRSKLESESFVKLCEDGIVQLEELVEENNITKISELIKPIIEQLKSGEEEVNPVVAQKLARLYSQYKVVNRRIRKLEEMPLESTDDEFDSPYTVLDKYKKKAVLIYNKICELEKKPATAERAILGNFMYSYGGVGPPAIQKAMQAFYNKTRKMPDFQSVLKLVNRVNKDQSLGLDSKQEEHNIAQQVFVHFAKTLQAFRIHDEETIAHEYLPDGAIDPAQFDRELADKLMRNESLKKKESDVLAEFVNLQNNLQESRQSSERAEEEGSSNSEEESDEEPVSSAPSCTADESDDSSDEETLLKRKRGSSLSGSESSSKQSKIA